MDAGDRPKGVQSGCAMFDPKCDSAEAPGWRLRRGGRVGGRFLVPDVNGESDGLARRALRVDRDHAERVAAGVNVPE